jgi:3D (Asp-Asp-Asp) domain-containing protein
MFPITTQEVEATIHQSWAMKAAQDPEQQQSFSASDATVFTCSSKRIERACIVCLQRERDGVAKASKLRVRLGDVHVLPLGSDVAVAFYTLQFQAQQVSGAANTTRPADARMSNARVTQVFKQDESSGLKIVQHISLVQP